MSEEKKLIFVKLSWRTNPIGTSILYFPLGSENLKERSIKIGDSLNLKIHGENLCVGTEVTTHNWAIALRTV